MVVPGAELIPAIELLSKPFVGATIKVTKFTSQYKTTDSILASIKTVFDDIDKLNQFLGRPHTETEAFTLLFSEGEKLLHKCSRVKKWDLINRCRYSKKLTKFQAQLVNFCGLVMPALQLREATRISATLGVLRSPVVLERYFSCLDEMASVEESLDLEIGNVIVSDLA